jgi:predicted nucleotidyltransferase
MVKTKSDITSLILDNKTQIQKFGARSIGLFGSFVSNSQNDNSDIDLIVEFEKEKKTYNNYINLTYFLEDLFNRKVELITPESISKYIKPHILNSTEYVSLSI